MVGIYKITSPTGKVYIGQSINLHNREKRYKSGDCKEQPYIHRSILKHSWGKHTFSVIHALPEDADQSILDTYEQLYMDLYIDCGVTLMNLKGAGAKGRLSEESKRKISLYQKGRPKSANHNKKNSEAKKGKMNPNFGKAAHPYFIARSIQRAIESRKSYIFVNPIGEKVSFIGLQCFCKQNKLNVGSMSKVFARKIKHYKGWTRWTDDANLHLFVKDKKKGSDKCQKTYIYYNPSGSIVSFTGMIRFCKQNNLNPSNMVSVDKGRCKQHKNWTRYEGND